MGADARNRQKKLQRRANRRKEKKHERNRELSAGLAERMSAAADCPILDCWVSDSLQSDGIGQVSLSRLLRNGSVAVASFLVDRYCLGVKDATAVVLPRPEYEEKYQDWLATRLPGHAIAPADARRMVEDAVAYARSIGMHPHPDYVRAKPLFGSIVPADGAAPIEFGKDGKPLFVSGPNDSPGRCRQIMAILTNTCGPGFFDYIIGIGDEWDDDDDFDLEEQAAHDEWDEDEEL